MKPGALHVLIVDDEPLARLRIRSLLRADPDVGTVAEAATGAAAVAAITATPEPDVVFLDIEMPGLGGFDVIEAVGADRMPAVIFTTAYDRFAIRAFEVHAVDYLLKPFERERFQVAVARVKAVLRERRGSLAPLLHDLSSGRPFGDRIPVRAGGRIRFVELALIGRVDAEGTHARLVAGEEQFLVRQSLTALETLLPRPPFFRIHRSVILNLDHVQGVEPWFGGDYVFRLRNGTTATSGKSYRPAIRAWLDRAL
jgi:two-component system LytT family response regulator